ncbi:MAG: hypothetical protein Q9207_007525, partial [Kuettlingeria erythrocarpa]
KFRTRSALKWDEESLFTVLGIAYNTTPASDRGLGDIIAEICSSYINDSSGTLLSNSRFEAIIKNDGALAFEVPVRIYGTKRAVDARVDMLERSLRTEMEN